MNSNLIRHAEEAQQGMQYPIQGQVQFLPSNFETVLPATQHGQKQARRQVQGPVAQQLNIIEN